jgi:precorrin-6B methylase 2
MDSRHAALVRIGQALKARGYRFVGPAPATCEIVNARPGNEQARTLADIFGWSRPFPPDVAGAEILALMDKAGIVQETDGLLRSTVRFSSLFGLLLVHSAFPTSGADAVYLGPDTYRSCQAIRAAFAADPGFRPALVADIGSGAGGIGLWIAAAAPWDTRVILTDINPAALRLSEVNAALNGIGNIDVRQGSLLEAIPEDLDLIVSNPPFMVDRLARRYCHGGGEWGLDLALQIAARSLAKLRGAGRLMLYTGAPVVDGADMFRRSLDPLIDPARHSMAYDEVEPDIYPEELLHPPYTRADRIAAVFAVIAAR